MESNFVAFDETLMCMSTACDVIAREGLMHLDAMFTHAILLSSSGLMYAVSVVNLLSGVGTVLPLKRPTSPC